MNKKEMNLMKIGKLAFIRNVLVVVCLLNCCSGFQNLNAQVAYPGRELPGVASIQQASDKISFENKVLSFSVLLAENKIAALEIGSKIGGSKVKFPAEDALQFTLGDAAKKKNLSEFSLEGKVIQERTAAGETIAFQLRNIAGNISLKWKIVLENDQNFVRQFLEVVSADEVKEIDVLPLSAGLKPEIMGTVEGSPVIAGGMFWAFENPFFTVKSGGNTKTLSLIPRNLKETFKGNNIYKEVVGIGVYPTGQLRRAFQFYLDKIRRRPYAPITFYDSWYDLSYDLNVLTEKDCIDRVKTFGDSLKKRNTHLDAFLWDSGWDDWNNMWNFNPQLKNGFKEINKEVRKYNASSGAWISPWGGYSPFLEKRINSTKDQYKIFRLDEYGVKKGLTLADPNYYHYVKSVMFDLIKNHGVSLFKIDGMGAGLNAEGPGKYREEMEALIKLIGEVRAYYPEVYLNLTVGIWPSPFWLRYADNIWKGGTDFGSTGAGNERQRWMNFRDLGVLKVAKQRAPLCPISAVMLHGVTYADLGPTTKYESDDLFIKQDIWSFFASGTSLQELYINPHKMNSFTWDVLAKAIRWTRANKESLIDAHWVGGDPAAGQVYGYGSWSPLKSTLMLRNPSTKTKEYKLVLGDALELPQGFEGSYSLYNIIEEKSIATIQSNKAFKISLKPFEVLVLNIEKK